MNEDYKELRETMTKKQRCIYEGILEYQNENGHFAPSLDLVVIIAQVMNVSLDYLLLGIELKTRTELEKEQLIEAVNRLKNLVKNI